MNPAERPKEQVNTSKIISSSRIGSSFAISNSSCFVGSPEARLKEIGQMGETFGVGCRFASARTHVPKSSLTLCSLAIETF